MKGLDVAIHLWQEPQAEIKCTICETTGAPLLSLGSVPIWTSKPQLNAIFNAIRECIIKHCQPESLQAQHERLEAMAANDPRILDVIGTAERDDFPPDGVNGLSEPEESEEAAIAALADDFLLSRPVVPNVASLQPTL